MRRGKLNLLVFFAPFYVCKQTIIWSFILSSIAGKLNFKLKVKLKKWGMDLVFYDSNIWILWTFPVHLTENVRNFLNNKKYIENRAILNFSSDKAFHSIKSKILIEVKVYSRWLFCLKSPFISPCVTCPDCICHQVHNWFKHGRGDVATEIVLEMTGQRTSSRFDFKYLLIMTMYILK